jgi:predicted class III extradiol MEMO1 family dioxygenase
MYCDSGKESNHIQEENRTVLLVSESFTHLSGARDERPTTRTKQTNKEKRKKDSNHMENVNTKRKIDKGTLGFSV